MHHSTRRNFLKATATASSAILSGQIATGEFEEAKPVRVVIWDEQQKEQKQAYENYLGNWIAGYLEKQPGLSVKSVRLDDPSQGLAKETLDECNVLIWWGHIRQGEIRPETGKMLVDRIRDGKLSLIALHSAHWSTPFVEAMNEVTRTRFEKEIKAENGNTSELTFKYAAPNPRYGAPTADARLTPCYSQVKYPDGRVQARINLPNCCFPAYRPDGKPSQINILKPNHPVVRDLPRQFEIPHTEMYNEPFHVPPPDEVLFEERWASGEWFRSGMVWNLGKGKVFYFRPGHETFAVFKEKPVLKILENAVRWLGGSRAE